MNVDIKVDVVGQIRLFRTATFPDKYPFIEEAIQNSQRSKATEIDFWFKENQLVITDNGIGLKSPQDLFTIAHSGWDEETKRDQKPFGIGFFSCVKMANKITVESNQFRILFDVRNVLEKGLTKVDVEELDPPVKGFRVILEDFTEDFDEWSINRAVKTVGQYIQDLCIRFNNNEVPKQRFDESDGSDFAKIVKVPGLRGWLRPWNYFRDYGTTFDYPTQVLIFYQDRYVKGLVVAPHLAGVIAITDNDLVDLRAPDRKDFIQNEKLETLKKRLFNEGKSIAIQILKNGTNKDIDKYQELIKAQMTVQEYKPYLNYLIVTNQSTISEILDLETKDPQEVKRILQELTPETDDTDSEQPNLELHYLDSTPPVINSDRARSNPRSSKTGVALPPPGSQLLYYVKQEDFVLYLDVISEALDYKIPIVIIRNELEYEAIKLREDILHVGELERKTSVVARVSNIGPLDLVEKRALWLFKIISRVLGIEKSPFIIGDLEVSRRTFFGPIEISNEELRPFGASDGKRIIIDRSKLQVSGLRASGAKKILSSDLLFIGANIDTIAHELTHYLYDTDDDTITHYKLQLDTTHKLMSSIFNYDLEELR